MEGKEGKDSGIPAKTEEAPVSNQPPPPTSAATTADPVVALAVVAGAESSSSGVKKKRGRPRKYGPDGVALSPMPISASIPLTGEVPAWQPPPQPKRGKVTPVEIFKKKQKLVFDSPAEKLASLISANFTPHVMTVNPGEDIIMKIMSISQQGARAVCVLSANGTISNVSLIQPTTSGGTLTYEGRFEIISLCGSYTPIERGGTTSTTGRMSVSLAGPDGRVLGGGLAGLLVAASPVQVVVGSFVPGRHHQQHQEQRPRSQRPESLSDPTIFRQETTNLAFGGAKPTTTEEDNIVPVQSIANSLGGNKISFSANALSS